LKLVRDRSFTYSGSNGSIFFILLQRGLFLEVVDVCVIFLLELMLKSRNLLVGSLLGASVLSLQQSQTSNVNKVSQCIACWPILGAVITYGESLSPGVHVGL